MSESLATRGFIAPSACRSQSARLLAEQVASVELKRIITHPCPEFHGHPDSAAYALMADARRANPTKAPRETRPSVGPGEYR